jgi:hypothetical protein
LISKAPSFTAGVIPAAAFIAAEMQAADFSPREINMAEEQKHGETRETDSGEQT